MMSRLKTIELPKGSFSGNTSTSPKSFADVLKSSPLTTNENDNITEEEQWSEAIKSELDSLKENNTWTASPLPSDKNAIQN